MGNVPNSGHATLRETFRLEGKDKLVIDFDYQDPEVFAAPYRWTWSYSRHDEHRVAEYICDNNQYSTNEDGGIQFNMDILN
jgi:hypothetical protein